MQTRRASASSSTISPPPSMGDSDPSANLSPTTRSRKVVAAAPERDPVQAEADAKSPSTKPKRKITKNEFMKRSSHLDPSTSESKLSATGFHGIYNLITMVLVLFFMYHQAKNIFNNGEVIGFTAAYALFFERFDLLPCWLLLVGLSLCALPLQRLAAGGWLADVILIPVHATLVSSLAFLSIAFCLWAKFPIVQAAFLLSEGFILFMKVHSYLMTNRELDRERKVHGRNRSEKQYPENVTLLNMIDYLIAPTLVYEIEYPRTESIRWKYLFEKVLTFAGVWAVMHVVVENYIKPTLRQTPQMHPLWAIGELVVPSFIFHGLVFYIIFDVICNGAAELTRFADRAFYDDWWNATSYDEYARKWNKPVHEWLLRHVYLETLETYKLSQNSATFVTFLFSSIFHELFLMVLFRMFRPYIFFLQMLQLPLIYITNRLRMKGTRAGNLFIWFGLLWGPPMMAVLYCREWYISSP